MQPHDVRSFHDVRGYVELTSWRHLPSSTHLSSAVSVSFYLNHVCLEFKCHFLAVFLLDPTEHKSAKSWELILDNDECKDHHGPLLLYNAVILQCGYIVSTVRFSFSGSICRGFVETTQKSIFFTLQEVETV